MSSRTLYRTFHPEHGDRLMFAGAFAIALHTAVIIFVGFDVEIPEERQLRSLNVSLVVNPTKDAPDDAKDIADYSQRGGNADEHTLAATAASPAPLLARAAEQARSPREAPAPQGAPTDASATAEAAAEKVAVIARESDQAPARGEAASQAPDPNQATKAERAPDQQRDKQARSHLPSDATDLPKISVATLLAQARDLAATDARFGARRDATARGEREAIITASTREHRLAAYMEAWRQKVERVGNLNYPEEARRKGITGTLLLDVTIEPDGDVAKLRLLRSSGHRVLDRAAARIVTLAAPFAKFPSEIARDFDVIHIQRTWRFSVVGLEAG